MSPTLPAVLSFAAADPTSGAGMQADVLSIASLGCHPLSVLTALTVQDTRGVESMLALEPALVERQARRVLEDIAVAGFKLGVLGSARNAQVIAAILAEHPRTPVVLDPVLASGRGDALADAATIDILRSALLPRTTVLTPNSLEARRLAGAPPNADLGECARDLAKLGSSYVLVTGTHETGPEVVNTLYDARGPLREDRWQRLPGSYHGSGCTLAAAIAALLARGMAVEPAVRQAQEYAWKSLAAGYSPGRGQAIPDRLFAKAMKLRGLYAITPEFADSATLVRSVAQALEGGIAMLQYRRKDRQQLEEARTLARMCRDRAVPFVVNDDIELALACNADGAHVGRNDGDPGIAREKIQGKLLGVSCYDSLQAAHAAVAAGADYVAFGSVFPSPTKPAARRAPLGLFGAARALGVPLIAIGGITLHNAPQLLAAGAECLAVISDLFEAPDIAERARAYGKLFNHDLAQ